MTVRSVRAIIEKVAQEHFEKIIPDNVDATWALEIFDDVRICEHGDLVGDMVLWGSLHVRWTEEPDRMALLVQASTPVDLMLDGDPGPVQGLLDHLWQQAEFGSIMADTHDDLAQVLEAEGGVDG